MSHLFLPYLCKGMKGVFPKFYTPLFFFSCLSRQWLLGWSC